MLSISSRTSWSRRREPRYVAPTRRDQIGRIWAPVLINGRGPFRLVLDTGASSSGVTAMVALALGSTDQRLAARHAARGDRRSHRAHHPGRHVERGGSRGRLAAPADRARRAGRRRGHPRLGGTQEQAHLHRLPPRQDRASPTRATSARRAGSTLCRSTWSGASSSSSTRWWDRCTRVPSSIPAARPPSATWRSRRA